MEQTGHRHRPSYHPSLCLLTRAPPVSTALEGQGRPQRVIGLEGGELHHNGTHWRSLLIWWKDRVPNRNVRTIRRLCAASLVGSYLVSSWLPDADPGRLQLATSLMAAIRRSRIGLVTPSIAHAIIALCSIADWQS